MTAALPQTPARLDDLKQDAAALLAVLCLERPGNHGRCVFCENRDAMSVHHSEAGWRFKCHSCGAAGSIVDAVALAENCTPADACKRLAGTGHTPRRPGPPRRHTFTAPREPLPPVPDESRLQALLHRATETLFSNTELQRRWLGKRGIPLAVAQAHGLGFMPWARFTGWKHAVRDTWVIPISDAAGKVLALKLHRENPPPKAPKCLWAPFGTEPKDGPRHGWATLWPPPETYWPDDLFQERAGILEFDAKLPRAEAEAAARLDVGHALPWLYLCPGELKALAVIGAGCQATSITAGESHRWTPGFLSRLAGRRLCVVFDDDPAGHRFRDTTIAALRCTASELKAVTFGRKEGK